MTNPDISIDHQHDGALPTLDSSSSRVLGEPQSQAKAKTNVGKFIILACVVASFVLVIIGLMLYQKYKKNAAVTTDIAKDEQSAKPGYASKNSAISSDSIDRLKTEIQKKANEEIQQKKIEEAQNQAIIEQQKSQLLPANDIAKAPDNIAPSRTASSSPRPHVPSAYEKSLKSDVLLANTGEKLKSETHETGQNPVNVSASSQQSMPNVSMQNSDNTGAQNTNIGSSDSTQSNATNELAARLQPAILKPRAAGRLPNLSFLLKKGTMIPCTLKTGIDTTLPGFVICLVMSDVYSADGKVLLVERGSTVLGEQQSSLKQGQTRTFVVWTRIDTPNGLFINIDSPASDQMGYSGIPGYVDTHFWARFGSAIMLSFIKDFSTAVTQRANSSNSQVYNNTTQTTQDMSADALRNSINIPPTLSVLPATPVNVMVARDISFENIYAVVQ